LGTNPTVNAVAYRYWSDERTLYILYGDQ